ncbi:MAG: VWA domain-containing protein [Chloroflexota bacterium]|nr:MAG: VWA domain-containing protein [Chloroflexota bacterium]
MTLFAPMGLLFLGLVPVVILFYILRARYERVEVPSTLLWRNVIRDTEGRPTWRPPIRNILLILQLLVVVAAALALARPAIVGFSATHHILVLDASMSMQAIDVAPSRFEDAKRLAADIAREAPDGDAVSVVRAGAVVDIAESGTDSARAVQAIAQLQPGVTGADMRAALQVADALARERPELRAEVTILSDGSFPELPAIDTLIAEVRVRVVGTSADNQAIVFLRARRALDGSNRYEGFGRITNFGAIAVEVPVRALADGIPVESRQVRVPARGSQEVIVPLSQSVKLFELAIDRPDALAIDNYAQVVVPNEDLDVTLVSTAPAFMERALRAVPSVKLTLLRPQQYKPDLVGAITVFDGFMPRGRDNLPPGAALFVNPPTGVNAGFDISELRQPQQIVRVNPRSPLLETVDLAGLFLPRALRVIPPAGSSPAVESKDTTLVWEGMDDGRKIVVFAFDPRQPEIGQRLAFPLLLANSIGWLAPNAGSATISSGQTYNIQPVRTARDVVVRDPGGRSYLFTVNTSGQARAIPFSTTDAVGRYAIIHRSDKGSVAQSWFTVNAGDEFQSDTRPKSWPDQRGTGPALLSSAVRAEAWPFLVMLGLGLLAIEWYVYARR